MGEIFNHPLVQFLIMIIAIMAGFIVIKTVSGALITGDSGWLAAVRRVIQSA